MINQHTIERPRHGQLLIDRIITVPRRRRTTVALAWADALQPVRKFRLHCSAAPQPSIASRGDGRAVARHARSLTRQPDPIRNRYCGAAAATVGRAKRGVLQVLEFARFL